MKWNVLKKYLGWKTLLILSLFVLAGCDGGADDASAVVLVLFLLVISGTITISSSMPLMAMDTVPPPSTNAAVLSVNWTKEAGATVQSGNYQLSLPFSDYTRTGQTVKPNNHFHIGHGFHFGVPLLKVKDGQGTLPENLDEAKQSNTPFSLSLTPVASNKQQLAESAQWLSIEENIPKNSLEASSAENMVRLYQPITLKRDNQVIATVNSVIVEKNQIQQGNSVNISFDGMYGPIKTQEKNTHAGPGSFSFVLNNLDASIVHKIEKEIQNIKHLPKEKQMLAQLEMLSQLKALCKKGSTLTVTYDVNTVTGPVQEHYKVDLSDLIKAPMQFLGPRF